MMQYNRSHILVLLIFLIIIPIYFFDFLTLENIQNNKIWLKEFINNNYFFSVFLFFISCLIFINSPIPLAALVKIIGGFLFGFRMGAIYNVIATIIACLAGFIISRYAFKKEFEKVYYDRLKRVENEIETNGSYYFLTLRLIMIIPYFIINIVAGISRISFKKYLFSTILGVIPASLIYANGGNKLEHINSVAELFKFEVIISLLLVIFISLFPMLIKRLNQDRY
ncbi:TVP38/TMEM64 family protein [Methylomarinum vadi]|uniref:TVP38/TMEM64 family protein n=1 Tax=Methylomarinum vadi TaxID=438855 RepID=UPI001F3AD88B|nr:TVP38/TMEM64 family protein [Methylomarinum vadi]